MAEVTRIKKNKDGYGYKYTELSQLNEYCEKNNIEYYQEVETCDINGEDYIITYTREENKEWVKHRGCKIVDAVLSGIKNPVQEYGSSLTYCRRYSLLMALGLATEDDDANSVSKKTKTTKTNDKPELVSEAQIGVIKKIFNTDERMQKLLDKYKIKKIEDMSKELANNIIKKNLSKKEEKTNE